MWLWSYMLAETVRMVRGRGMGRVAPGASGSSGRGPPDRLGEGFARFVVCGRQKGGSSAKTGAFRFIGMSVRQIAISQPSASIRA